MMHLLNNGETLVALLALRATLPAEQALAGRVIYLLRHAQNGDGARPSGRFTFQRRELHTMPVPLEFCELKRRERRAPSAPDVCQRIARASTIPFRRLPTAPHRRCALVGRSATGFSQRENCHHCFS